MRKSIKIENHVFETYRSLRLGIAAIAGSFPLALWLFGWYQGDSLQASWSAYYHASDLTRDIFVGTLVALGVFLILYKGYSRSENTALNIAGIFAIGVALFPMNQFDVDPSAMTSCTEHLPKFHLSLHDTCNTSVHAFVFGKNLSLHGFCALTFLASCAFVAYFTSGKSTTNSRLQGLYKLAGSVMVAAPVGLVAAHFIVKKFTAYSYPSTTFMAETAAVLSFVVYWVVKTTELFNVRDASGITEGELASGMEFYEFASKAATHSGSSRNNEETSVT